MSTHLRSRNFAFLLMLLFSSGSAVARVDSESTSSSLSLIENKGQITDQYKQQRPDVQYKLSTPGLTVFIGNGQIHYQWTRSTSPRTSGGNLKHHTAVLKNEASVETYRMDVSLIGANTGATVVSEEKQSYSEHYYLPQLPAGAVANSFDKITYKNVYPGIDWVLYTRGNEMKYDFVVRKGADPKQIRLRYGGHSTLSLKDGALFAVTPLGTLTEQKPYSYYADTRKEVPSSYTLDGDTLSFNVSAANDDIIIDPTLNWSTYFGGTLDDVTFASAHDQTGAVYIAGFTSSMGNIATTGAYHTTLQGSVDGYVAMFDNAGARQWSTYYGGTDFDMFYGLACDKDGNVIAAGETHSTAGIASTGAHQAAFAGTANAMLVKFSSTGTRQWATYYGNDSTFGSDVACDTAGNIYMTGITKDNSIATTGAHQATLGGGLDAYVVKFSSTGVRQWSTYYGGVATENEPAITTDIPGTVYLSGTTYSTTNIASTGAHQTTAGGDGDGFVAKFNDIGQRQWATYYGGPYWDECRALTCDTSGNVYITGATTSISDIATAGAYKGAMAGTFYDAFIAKFNNSGVRQWGTYYGGNDNDWGTGIEFVAPNSIFMVGSTLSTSGISTGGVHQNTLGGLADAFAVKFTTAGSRQWGTYLGGTNDEEATSITSDRVSNIFFTGQTSSTSAVATSGSYQATYGGGDFDGFVVRLSDCNVLMPPVVITGTANVCPGNNTQHTLHQP